MVVISWHLTDDFVKPDDLAANKIATLEKVVDKLSKMISSVETQVSAVDWMTVTLDKNMKGMQTKLDQLEKQIQKNKKPRASGGAH